MKTTINGRFLACLLLTTTILAAGTWFLHGYQLKRNAGAFLVQAQRAREQGNLPRAANYLARYLALVPGDLAAREEYALLLDRLASPPNPNGRLRAFLALEQVLRRQPERDDLRRELVRIAMSPDLARHSDACHHLDALLRSSPGDAGLELLMARCLEAGGDVAAAEKWYRQAIQHAPDQVESYSRLARILRHELKQPAEADKVMNSVVTVNNKSFAAHLARARYRKGLGLLEEAARDTAAARNLAPDNAEVLLESAELARARGKLDEARTHLARSLKLHPNTPGPWLSLAGVHLQSGERKEAIAVLRKGLKACPGQADLQWNLADVLLRGGEVEEPSMIAAGLRRHHFTPVLLDYLKARALYVKEHWATAAVALEAILPRLSPWPDLVKETNLVLGQAYEQLGDADRQHAAYHRVVAADPLSVPGCLGLGTALAATGKIDDALDVFRRVASRMPTAHLVMAHLAILSNLQRPPARRDWAAVNQNLAEADRANPKSTSVPILQAEALVAQGQLEQAAGLLEAALDKQPGQVELTTALAGVIERQGKPDVALALLEKALGRLDSVDLHLARLRLLARKGKPALLEACAKLESDLPRFKPTECRRLLLRMAEAHASAGSLAEAERLWSALEKQRPDDLSIKLALFDLALRGKKETRARQLIDEMRRIEGSEGTMSCYASIQEILWRARSGETSSLSQARELADKLSGRRPFWSPVALCQAEISELSGESEAAIPFYLRAIDLGERAPRIIQRAVRLLYERRRFFEADQIIRKLPEQSLALGGLRRLAADVSLRTASSQGDFGQALEQARKAVHADSKDYRDHIWLGQVLAAQDRQAEAVASLRRAVQLAPTAPEAWVALVEGLMRFGQKEKAALAVLEAESHLPSPDSALPLARCQELLGNTKKAGSLYRQALGAAPTDFNALANLAGFLLRQGEQKEALDHLQKIIALKVKTSEEAAWARRTLAILLAASQDYQQSRQALGLLGQLDEADRSVKPNSSNPADQRARAAVLATQKSTRSRREAIRLFESIQAAQPPTPEERFFLARLHESVGDHLKAYRQMAALVSEHGDNPRFVDQHVRALLARKETEEAATWVAKLEKLAPKALPTLELKARLLSAQGKTAEAVALIEGYADGKDARLDIAAQLLEAIGAIEPASAMYRKFVSRSARPESMLLLAAYLGRQRQTREALDLCERAWKTCPPADVAGVCLGVLMASETPAKHLDRVAGWLEKARREHPSVAAVVSSLASVRNLQGRYQDALTLYQLILERDPGNVAALNNRSWLLAMQAGKPNEALALIEKALAIEGPAPWLLDTRGLIHIVLGRGDLAVKDLNEVISEAPSASRYFHLAQAHHKGGNRHASAIALRKARALGLAPSQLHALEHDAYRHLLSELGQD